MEDQSQQLPDVRVGQTWIDCDRRARGRRLVVKGIGSGCAVVENVETGRKSRVRLNRFRQQSNGYRLAEPSRDTDLL
jgi:hypothetical protein